MAEERIMERERELEVLRDVAELALSRKVDRIEMARVLLRVASQFLGVGGEQVGLILREWSQPSKPTEEPEEVRRRYFVQPDGTVKESTERKLYIGIPGRAFEK